MKATLAFILSAILAVIAAVGLLIKLIPPGEGAFGIAKAVPLILTILIPAFFCLIWFPANLLIWRSLSRERKRAAIGVKSLLVCSGMLFLLTLAIAGYFLVPLWRHKVHFYFRLEDQFGQPVTGAIIRRHIASTTFAGDKESKSDERGLFDEFCRPGESFSLNLRKDGYALASLNTTWAYSEELRAKQKSSRSSSMGLSLSECGNS